MHRSLKIRNQDPTRRLICQTGESSENMQLPELLECQAIVGVLSKQNHPPQQPPTAWLLIWQRATNITLAAKNNKQSTQLMSGPLPPLVLHGEGPVSRKREKREDPRKMERRETMWAVRNDESATQCVLGCGETENFPFATLR